jgi:hypothetical protein
MTIHVMIDGETPDSNAATTSFLTLAAVPFIPETGEILPAFYGRCSLSSLLMAGFSELQATADWWQKQSQEARDEAFGGTGDIKTMWLEFSIWCKEVKDANGPLIVWGNGSDFDNVICSQSFKKFGIDSPWLYTDNRCYRTLKNILPNVTHSYIGVKHSAVDDARNQAMHACKILSTLL